MYRRALITAGCVLAAGWLVMGPLLPPLVRLMMEPGEPFGAAPPPPAPDYGDDAAWSALPTRDDAADASPDGEPGVDQRAAPADVFYVHPTSYVGSAWNATWDDPATRAASDAGGARIQASAFNGCCAVYAPYYRQANGSAFYAVSADGEAAIDLAWSDVDRAFTEFLRRRGPDRPFLVAAHSQGSVLAERLLTRRVAGTPLERWFVAAWLPGGPVTVAGLAEAAPTLHPCATPDDTRCVAAWNARGPGYASRGFDLVRPDLRERLCTNPITWRADGEPAAQADNPGAVFLDSPDHAVRPGFADAACAGGTLVVRAVQAPPRDLPSRVLDRALGAGNYHPIEYQLYYESVRRNAVARLQAWTPPAADDAGP